MSIYDTARQLKIPGVVVQAHIDPTQITPRIKKMVQTMIRKGQLKGGGNSKSLMLARHLLQDKGLPMLAGWNGTYRAKRFDDAQLSFFDEMFEADAALEKITLSEKGADSAKWALARLAQRVRENKLTVRRVDTTMMGFWLGIDSPEIREQVNERLLALRLPEDVAALDVVAARLDDPTPIPVKLSI